MSKQLGMTLIELMVALALGLIITAAGVQLFVSGTINYSLQKTLGELQDNGNFGLNYITKPELRIRKALEKKVVRAI